MERLQQQKIKLKKKYKIIISSQQLLNTRSLISIYFSYFRTYLNYANIAWASTQKNKLKINIEQKHAVRIIFNEDRLCHSRPLLKTLKVLNVYQLNINQNLNFSPRLKNDNIPKIFTELIKKLEQISNKVFKKQLYHKIILSK